VCCIYGKDTGPKGRKERKKKMKRKKSVRKREEENKESNQNRLLEKYDSLKCQTEFSKKRLPLPYTQKI